MGILKNLKRMHAAVIAQQVNGDSPLGTALNNAAVPALLGGMGSKAFESYMAVFVDNPDQLARLTVQKAGEPFYVSQMRAYIVSNAICDITTTAFLNNRVDARIDGGQAGEPVVPDASNDPNGEIAALRPADLKVIPDVHI